MENKQLIRRGVGLLVLLCAVFMALGATLYDAQIIKGSYWAGRSSTKITDQETVSAARGQILDRYGRVLVSNRVTYQVTLDAALMGDARNEILTKLLQTARESEVEWTDTLPVSAEGPFAYTVDAPFYTVSQEEDGTITRTLTRLGKLAVKMGWLSGDPTDPAKTVSLPTAQELLVEMCDDFSIPVIRTADGGLRSDGLTDQEVRALVGVLYELYLRSQEVYQTTYLFAEDVGIDFISRVKEQNLSGVEIDAVTTREYNTSYAAHLLGRVALMSAEEWEYYKTVDLDGDGLPDYKMSDSVGKEGVELAFESYLRGSSGVRQVDRDTNGKIVDETWVTEPEPGKNVVLTIDIDLQKAVEDILAESVPGLSESVEGAACVVLDVNTAEVLASASYPTYDLENYSRDYAENLENPLKPFLNRAFSGLYPPGSTFKMVTAIAGLETGEITPTTKIRDTGRYTYYTEDGPMCWIYRQHRSTHGLLNVTEAIRVSCNVFFFDVGRRVGIAKLQEYAAAFGLGEASGIELSEQKGVMAGPEYTQSLGGTWYEGSTLSVAIGQESSQFTPLQLANYIATLVNGGTRNAVHLLKEVKSSDFSQVLYTQEPEVLNTVEIQPENLEAVKLGMLELTTSSLASAFQGLSVQVGAKTGSAQVNAQTDSNAVFVCFAPYDDPQVAIALVVEKGGSGSGLAKIAANILNYYFSAEGTREEITTENTLIR